MDRVINMRSFHIYTLGCKVNQYESEAMAQALEEHGWTKSSDGKKSDICIINTCTVTGKGSMQSRQAVRNLIRQSPDAVIIVTGCYAQTETLEISKIEGVHYIIGTSEKHSIPDMIVNKCASDEKPEKPVVWVKSVHNDDKGEEPPAFVIDNVNSSNEKEFFDFSATVKGNRARPYLKIQEGCNAFCTYCIVPHARGRSRSMQKDQVFRHLERLSGEGVHEVVLTGIHVGMYGLDLTPKTSFLELLREIGDRKAVGRLRLSSIEPRELTGEIIEQVSKSDSFCNYFHIPLQSGDDGILKRMKRPYTGGFFRELVQEIKRVNPTAAIGVDTLVGFPGETDEAFENTYKLLESLPVTYLHVFPYSRRSGTPAADYPDQVDPGVLKKRCSMMRELSNRKKEIFAKENIGKTVEIIIEGKRDSKTGMLKGVSSNYITVLAEGGDEMFNRVVNVELTEVVEGLTMSGMLADM